MKLDEIQKKNTESQRKKLGAIPWYEHAGKVFMLFMTPSDPAYGGTRPQIAKGRQDAGESALHAALREAAEELGLRGSNIRAVSGRAATENILGADDAYQLTVYAVEVKNPRDFDQPHYETASTHWLSLENFLIQGRQNQAGMVKKVYEIIQNQLNQTS
jgi:8-oxo-dGTP pyrophosphatase MutT (NUDIX family)